MAELTNRMLDSWSSGKSVWIDKEFEALTSQIALKTLFDLDDPGDRDRFGEALHLAFDLMTARLRKVFKLLLWMPTAANLRLQRAIAELDRTVQNFIASGRSRCQVGEPIADIGG
jgi:cytochrome P450